MNHSGKKCSACENTTQHRESGTYLKKHINEEIFSDEDMFRQAFQAALNGEVLDVFDEAHHHREESKPPSSSCSCCSRESHLLASDNASFPDIPDEFYSPFLPEHEKIDEEKPFSLFTDTEATFEGGYSLFAPYTPPGALFPVDREHPFAIRIHRDPNGPIFLDGPGPISTGEHIPKAFSDSGQGPTQMSWTLPTEISYNNISHLFQDNIIKSSSCHLFKQEHNKK